MDPELTAFLASITRRPVSGQRGPWTLRGFVPPKRLRLSKYTYPIYAEESCEDEAPPPDEAD